MIFTWCRWCDTMMIINIMFMMMFMIMFMMLFTMNMMLMMMMMGMIAGALPCLFAFPDLWAPPWREGGCEGEKLWYDPDHDHDHNDDNVEDDHNHDHDHDDHNDDNVDDDHYNGDYKFSLQIAFHTFPLPPAQSRRCFRTCIFCTRVLMRSRGVSRVLRWSKNVSF